MPPIEDDLTEAQEHYFKSGGDVTDALVNESKDPAAEPATQETPVVESAPKLVPEQVPQETDESDDEVSEGSPEVSAPEQKQRRRVSRREFESERQARLKAEQTLQEQAVRNARVEERLSLLQQALQEPAQPEAQAPARPDPEQDIFGYVRWLEEQHNAVNAKVQSYEEQIQTGQAEMDSERRYFDSLNNYAATKPDFVNAYAHAIRSRAAQLVGESYSGVTDEELAGVRNGTIQIPKPIADQLRQEERSLYKSAFDNNRDPAVVLYRYAQSFGYQPPQQQPRPNGAAPASAPLGAPPAAAPARAPAAAPTATDVIASIQRGQSASASLSKAGGTAPDTELTPQALADMSEEQFAALFNELQASGNKDKLRQLFGQ